MTDLALKYQCDLRFSHIIRSEQKCQIRGMDMLPCGGHFECAHIITRGNKTLRYDPHNALCLCSAHHRYYTDHPSEWDLLIRKNFPTTYDYLEQNRNIFTKPDYKTILKFLNNYEI